MTIVTTADQAGPVGTALQSAVSAGTLPQQLQQQGACLYLYRGCRSRRSVTSRLMQRFATVAITLPYIPGLPYGTYLAYSSWLSSIERS